MALLYNLARMTTATTGTGTITLGSAVTGCLTFANAGVKNGDVVAYGIADGNNSEVGFGTYTASGTTLTRTVLASTNSNNPISLSGTAQVFITILAQQVRERLTADRTYFVRTDGADTNNGLANTTAGAFLTWGKAWNTITGLDTAGFNVIVQVADGTYSAAGNAVVANQWWVGGGTVIFQGNAGAPANVILSVAGNNAFTINDAGPGVLRLKDFRITTPTADTDHIFCKASANIEFGNMNFGAASGAGCHVRAFHPGVKVKVISGYTIAGGAWAHALMYYGVFEGSGFVITITGTPTFSQAFLHLDANGKLVLLGVDFTGTFIGKRHQQLAMTLIQTGGKPEADYFPGTLPGERDTSSVWK